jgi:hypothetical protein
LKPADVYNIDGFMNTAETVSRIHKNRTKAICYINAGAWEKWRSDAKKFPKAVLGNANGWRGEKWLDIRQTTVLLPIMQARISMCKNKGFDAIEFDNVDAYINNSGFPLSSSDQAYYNASLANMAHAAGLWAGLKNDNEQIIQLLPFFDFAINEQCFEYHECDELKPFIIANKVVFNVEYKLKPSEFCKQAQAMRFNSIKKSLELGENAIFCNDI